MTLPTDWRVKRGDDWTAPQLIVVKVSGTAANISTGWTVLAKAAYRSPDSTTKVSFTVDVTGGTAGAELSLARTTTAAMAVGQWWIDVEATHATYGRHSSESFPLEVVADVTR